MKKFIIILIVFLSCLLLISCSNSPPQETILDSEEQEKAIIDFVDYNHYSEYDYYHIVGVLINNGELPAERVKVKVIFYDENDKLLFIEKAYSEPYDILPGQKATFEILFPVRTFHHFEMTPLWNI